RLRSRRLSATGRSATSSERAIRYQRFGRPVSSRSSVVRGSGAKGCVFALCMPTSTPQRVLRAEPRQLAQQQLDGPCFALRAVHICIVQAGGEPLRRVDAFLQQRFQSVAEQIRVAARRSKTHRVVSLSVVARFITRATLKSSD